MQTWQLLQVLRLERQTWSARITSTLRHTVRPLSTTTLTNQEEIVELADDNASSPHPQQPKLKGKQRWRARQRELRAESEKADSGQESAVMNTSDVEDGTKPEDADLGLVNIQSGTQHSVNMPIHRQNRASFPEDLPKPSYLRPSLQDILRKKLLEKYVQTPARKPNPGGDKLQDSMKSAPFQTAFAQNPYAHTLASPVREDILSRVHLPMSCLLAFHVAELDQDPDKSTETTSRNKGRKERDQTVQYQLLPLSLATELAPSSKGKIPRDSRDNETPRDDFVKSEARSLRPTGSASYLSANYDAISFISKDAKRRLIPFGLSRRMHHEIGTNRDMQPSQVKWRPDMPDFVLGALRSIVAKKLGYLLKSKRARDRPGLVYEVLGGGHDLRRLHQMEHVSCVIRLTLSGKEDESDGEASNTAARIDVTQQTWQNYPFLDKVMPLPSSQSYMQSPGSPAEVVAYRNINIPVYSMHKLLGTRMASKLVAQTVFAQGGRSGTEQSAGDDEDQGSALREPTKYVVLTRSNGTLQAQIWLSKLQSFIGSSTTHNQPIIGQNPIGGDIRPQS